ncbi:hypothetical protein BBJ29_005971 [Phytophthora kernoviae]|uniref:Protein kinase domain-containing protein n=1 Tax=Phytophthora kernoviae TaxID=325452 RepID=A0A3F2RI50_9STRA|nr:hypothetical protein BBP00_00007533 [Phytophthora kernoviae]RLN69542.1 hypothetical protein BBJ29_005971 [Phytophthora kernoviae]
MRPWLMGGLMCVWAMRSLAHAIDPVDSPVTSYSFSRAGIRTNLRNVKTPTEALELTISTGSGVQVSSASGGSASSTGNSAEDKTLALWLSISIPLVLLLTFAVAMFFCCRKERQLEGEPDLETGLGSFNVYQIHRRPRGTPNTTVARLTQEDEDALASWRIDAENIAPIRPLGAAPSKLDSSNGPSSGNAANLQMVLEFMSGGDLRQYLARTRSDVRARVWGARKLTMALDIAEAIAYLHSRQPKPVLHRDLKSRNILLDSTFTAKVADFGVSRYGIPHSMEGEEVEDDENPSSQLAMTRSIGTSRWIAPEVLAGEARYSAAVDVYSFGVILSELDSHDLPFADVSLSNGEPLSENRILELLQSGALHPSLSDRCPRGVAMLMFECLTLEPTLRPTSAQVADRLRTLLERERRVSDIGDDVSFSSMSGPNSFLGIHEDGSSAYSGSVTSSSLSVERAFHYALLEEE